MMKMINKREQKAYAEMNLMPFRALNTSEELKTEPQTPCWGSANDETVSENSQYTE